MAYRFFTYISILVVWNTLIVSGLQKLSSEDINKFAEELQGDVNNIFAIPESHAAQKPNANSGESLHPAMAFAGEISPATPSYNQFVDTGSPEALRAKFSEAKTLAIQKAKNAILAELVSKKFISSFKIAGKLIIESLEAQEIFGTTLGKDCSNEDVKEIKDLKSLPECLLNPYRTINGSCNNIINRELGTPFNPFVRLIKEASYADGISAPRKFSSTGKPLLSPRKISAAVILNSKGLPDDHPNWSHFYALWGQFLDHDITNTPQFSVEPGKPPLKCCVPNPHQECFPIDTTGDPVYGEQTCMEFLRSFPADNCKLGIREQLNQVTAFIDGSQIYGSTTAEADKLKDSTTGKLRVTNDDEEGDLLLNENGIPASECRKPDSLKSACNFVAGDSRVNMVPSLTSIHTVFMRQHNRLVDLLRFQGWNKPEELYQEARRILVAQLQHITYNEFLKITFLRSINKLPDLNLKNDVQYDFTANPTITNEFATAALRFGHSMINNVFSLLSIDSEIIPPNKNNVSEHYFTSKELYQKNKIDNYLRGHNFDHSQNTDNILTDQLTNFLFKAPGAKRPALDLASLNIQRGRDHGLPSYTAYREICKLSVPTTFKDLNSIMRPETVDLLQMVYRNPEDIDLWVGGVCETIDSVGAVGPVFGCILSQQFSLLRRADRYFYNHRFNEEFSFLNPFTEDQIQDIEKTSLALILCANSKFRKIHEQAMLITSLEKDCSEILKNDLNMEKFSIDRRRKLPAKIPNTLLTFLKSIPPNSKSSHSTESLTQQANESLGQPEDEQQEEYIEKK